MYRIILKKGKGESLKRYHPWVFSGAVGRIEQVKNIGKRAGSKDSDEELHEGDVVEVYSSDGQFLGIGHYQIGTIAVRILSFTQCNIDEEFWFNALKRAYDMRVTLNLAGCRSTENNADIHSNRDSEGSNSSDNGVNGNITNAYRLVHGEGDFLPGLIIDIYGETAVMQAHSAGMFLSRVQICSALRKIYGKLLIAIYDKSSATAPFKAGLELKDSYLFRTPDIKCDKKKAGDKGSVDDGNCNNQKGKDEGDGQAVILENGNRFYVNWVEGQKTGFFLDQRNNRELVRKYSKGKNVLNLFCYTGGFSVYALAGGATHVDSVDSSQKAIDMAIANAKLNGFSSEHTAYCTDAIDYLQNSEKGKYDLMIVDPPAFAKHRGAMQNALRAYKRLNAAAIEKISAGGIIFTFSCSQVVDKNEFALAIFSAAAQSGRKVRILYRLTQPQDHPVNIYHPEGEYLKGLVLFVE